MPLLAECLHSGLYISTLADAIAPQQPQCDYTTITPLLCNNFTHARCSAFVSVPRNAIIALGECSGLHWNAIIALEYNYCIGNAIIALGNAFIFASARSTSRSAALILVSQASLFFYEGEKRLACETTLIPYTSITSGTHSQASQTNESSLKRLLETKAVHDYSISTLL